MHGWTPMALVHRMSGAASSVSDAVVPRPIRAVLDRTLVDAACTSRGGVVAVAHRLGVDPPAVDAWRRFGVPPELRARLAALAVVPDRPGRRAA